MPKIDEALSRGEELRPELRSHVVEIRGNLVVKHPLYFCLSVTRELSRRNSWANGEFREKQQRLAEAQGKDDWVGAIWCHEGPYRVRAMLQYQENLTDKQYWQTLRKLWMDSENIWQNRNQWVRLLRSNRAGKSTLMTRKELAKLNSLPDKITVWRGCTKRNKDGVSWTLSEDKANFFAYRFGKTGQEFVRKRVVRKQDVLAYFADRKEFEVLIVRGLK